MKSFGMSVTALPTSCSTSFGTPAGWQGHNWIRVRWSYSDLLRQSTPSKREMIAWPYLEKETWQLWVQGMQTSWPASQDSHPKHGPSDSRAAAAAAGQWHRQPSTHTISWATLFAASHLVIRAQVLDLCCYDLNYNVLKFT